MLSQRICALLLLCSLSAGAWAAIDPYEFDTEVQRQRYLSFIDEMRCPKCQNQNLSGSDSTIANDLRRELYELIMDGRSDKEIIDFMVARYGEYILYRPRLTAATLVLWLGPVFLFLLGVVVLIMLVRQRRLANQSAPDVSAPGLAPDEQARLQTLLNNHSTPPTPEEEPRP